MTDPEPLTPEALDTIEAARMREVTALRRVWQAMGCELDPDDFKPAVRDRIWDLIVAQAEADTHKNNRLYRENEQLRAELRRLRTENEEAYENWTGQTKLTDQFMAERDAANERSGWAHDKLVEVQAERDALKAKIDAAISALSDGPSVMDSYSAVRAALTGEATE